MKKIFAILSLIIFATKAEAADVLLAKYNQTKTVTFCLYTPTGAALKTDATHSSGDTVITKDEGVEANTTNAFTDEGNCYSLVLTATETSAARINLIIKDNSSAWLDKVVTIETYGNASAEHAFDLDTSTVVSSAVSSGGISSSSFASGAIDSTAIATDAITASKIAADSIGASEIAADAITTSELADGSITAAKIASDAITSAKIAADSIGASEIAASAITSSELADDAITAAKLAADSITSSEVSSTAGAKIADITMRRTTANVEASSDGDTLSRKSLYGAVANQTHRIVNSGTSLTIYKADGSTTLSTRTTTTSGAADPITGIAD